MNASHPPKASKLWHQPPAPSPPVEGYDAWLITELALGVADLDEGRMAPIADVRKEFDLE